ncbi:MAG: hypothetical protein HUU38_29820 [Anaerolineales bacterium]|jgi:hypothetical protein|nr:hypothetical protein [Anaerolineales bacterium]
MKTRPFFIATLVSAILQGLYYVIVTGLTLLFLPNMLETFVQDVPTSGGPPPEIFNFMGVSILFSLISLVLTFFVHTGTGIFYAWLHRREDRPVSAEQGALGGAASAFTARFVAGLLTAAGALVVSNIMMTTLSNAGVPELAAPTNLPPMFLVANSLTTVVGSLFSACFGSIVAAALGALGGALTGAILK